jgi:hypothetical protein
MKMNHIMSVENHLSEPAEPVSVGKGQRSQPKSNSPADATSDGVFVDGMAGNDTEISREICFGGSHWGQTNCRRNLVWPGSHKGQTNYRGGE